LDIPYRSSNISSSDLSELIEKGQRPQFSEKVLERIRSDTLISRVNEIFQKCTHFQPQDRPSAAQLVQIFHPNEFIVVK